MMPDILSGTVVPLVTPFDASEAVDVGRLGDLVQWLADAKPAALMCTALTGEGPLLDEAETRSVWEAGVAAIDSRLPLVPAVVVLRTVTACRLVSAAEELGAMCVMVAPILLELYSGRSEDDVYRFYSDVADATSLPLILFNYPSLTGVDLTPPLVERLCTIPSVAAIKESTGDARRVHELKRRMGDRLQVICGSPTTALESLALGCTAWITGTMNVAPRSAGQLMRAVEAGNLSLARDIYFRQLLPLADLIAASNNPTGLIKAGVTVRGVDVGYPRRPGSALDPTHLAALRRHCKELDDLEAESEATLHAQAGVE